jgi:carbonic anhydrase
MTNNLNIFKRKLRVYRKRNFKFDFIAAAVVFLVAIPLCLGIALASGAPLMSGVLSGIIGGIVVGSLSGSHVSISGPAAGMAAMVVWVITQLGDFNLFLLALSIAGIIQILLGIFKAGFIAEYIPSNVIQGLLCAVGILIIIKQLPFAFTLLHTNSELKAQLFELSQGLEIAPLRDLSFHINSGATILSLTGFGILIYLDKTKIKIFQTIPGAFIVVLLGIILNECFILSNSYLAQEGPHLVNIPQHNSFSDFYAQMHSPNWSEILNPNIYVMALLLAVVSSLENLLNVKAGEKIDRLRRYCSKDRELFAQGVGNMCAGLIGGIPVTAVIVRTSVNIQAGAKTKMATIFHGIFLLLTVIFIPNALNKIPLSSLAAILIYTGYKLTKPVIYKTLYKQGWDRFVPFITTVIAILFFNLLIGIILGLIISFFFILKSNSQARLNIIKEIYPNGTTNRLVLPQQTTFLNKASLIAELELIPNKSQLIIDASYTDYIDKEMIEFIKEFKNEKAPNKHISLNLIGFKDRYSIHNYIDFINVTTYDVQSTLTPHQVLNILREGNQRFLHDTCIHRSVHTQIQYTASTQFPIAVVLGCIDSRVPVETVFDMGFGDLFCVRVAGNVVNNDVLASIEYACHVVGAKLIVVLGHTRCGAVQAACDGVTQGHITQLLSKIQPAINAEQSITENRNSSNQSFVQNVTELNIAHTLLQIHQNSQVLQQLINDEKIGIVGATYDVHSGDVNFKNYATALNAFDKDSALAQKLQYMFKE